MGFVSSYTRWFFIAGMWLCEVGGPGYYLKILWFALLGGCAPIWCLLRHFSPGGSGVLCDSSRIEEEIRKAWLLFASLGVEMPTWRNYRMRWIAAYRPWRRFPSLLFVVKFFWWVEMAKNEGSSSPLV